MKHIVAFISVIVTLFNVSAQKYIHYYMNDDSFNGFYTSTFPEIRHDSSTQISSIMLNGKEYNIPMQNIDKIVIEDAEVSDNFDGDYRIYEKNDPQGPFKKIIADTRASLLASKLGNFGANDTILYSSDYNNERLLFFTDNLGRIKKIFTGKSLYTYLYSDNGGMENIIEFTEGGEVIEHPELFVSSSGPISKNVITKAPCNNIYRDFFENIQNINDHIHSSCENLVDNYTNLKNNPELHNQFLIVDGIIVAKDLVGVGRSLSTALATRGLSWIDLILNTKSLYDSGSKLLNDMFPDSEQMERYKDYYQNKYGIVVKAIEPTNITSTTADIRGVFYSTNGIKGRLYFRFQKLFDSEMWTEISPTIEPITSQSVNLSSSIDMLKPRADYFYCVEYQCIVDGMQFTFTSDPVDFMTLTPEAITLGLDCTAAKSAKVKCTFKNVPDGAICGIQYGTGGSSNVINVSPIEDAQLVTISGLSPNTTYSYRAFIQYEDETYYGETDSFTTDEEEAPIFGHWKCVWTQTPPNAKLLHMTLNENYTMSQTYYYANRGTNVTYSCTFSYNGDSLTFYKDNGDTQHWTVSILNEHNLSIVASNGFTYNFTR